MQPVRLNLVLLHHTGIDKPHYDVMFETAPGSLLTTFRIASLPSQQPIAAERLNDHRRLYLDFEGPLSKSRGEVKRIAWCPCWIMTNQPDRISLTLEPMPPFDRYLKFWKDPLGWQCKNEPY